MTALPQQLLEEVNATLVNAGRRDLAESLTRHLKQRGQVLTSSQAAKLLGVASPNTVKNWLQGGHFPGAYQTRGGHWRFPLEAVLAVKQRMELLETANRSGGIAPGEDDEDDASSLPLL